MKAHLFNQWNEEKKALNQKEDVPVYINEREIWFTKMGVNIGYEENGKDDFLRPVVVIKKIGNLFLTVALTSNGKMNSPYYYLCDEVIYRKKKSQQSSFAILSHIRVMDKRRFYYCAGAISSKDFAEIKRNIITLLQ